MSELFMRQKGFNDDISAWDTSSVTTMRLMCSGASSFNQPLNDWRVNDVTIVTGIFKGSALKPWQDVGDSKLRSQKPCCAVS